MSRERQAWALTEDSLAALLRFLDADVDRAAAEYERIRQRLTRLFRWRGCTEADYYTDATVDRVARLVAGGTEVRTANRYALFHGVAVNLLREHWRSVGRQRQALEGLAPVSAAEAPDEVLARRDAERVHTRQHECLRRCLDRLTPDNLALITRYYTSGPVLDKNQRKAVAAELQITVNALRVRAHRVRSELGDCVDRCAARQSE